MQMSNMQFLITLFGKMFTKLKIKEGAIYLVYYGHTKDDFFREIYFLSYFVEKATSIRILKNGKKRGQFCVICIITSFCVIDLESVRFHLCGCSLNFNLSQIFCFLKNKYFCFVIKFMRIKETKSLLKSYYLTTVRVQSRVTYMLAKKKTCFRLVVVFATFLA